METTRQPPGLLQCSWRAASAECKRDLLGCHSELLSFRDVRYVWAAMRFGRWRNL